MRKFLFDAFDLARFRARSLDHYVYDWRLPVLWVTFLGVLPALGPSELKQGILGRVLFCVTLNWAQALLITLFFTWWLKLNKRWDGKGSLFPIVALADSAGVIAPLFDFLPDAVAFPAVALFAFYQTAVLVNALSRTTGVKLGHTLLGLLAFLPTALMLAIVAFQISINMGWITPPPVSDNPADLSGVPQLAKPAPDTAKTDGGVH